VFCGERQGKMEMYQRDLWKPMRRAWVFSYVGELEYEENASEEGFCAATLC
jgi:hypothetical protein